MKAHDFLVEIGAEEVPDWMIENALDALRDRFFATLGQQLSDWRVDATPRRLVLLVRGIPEKEPDRRETLKGPPVSAGEIARQRFAEKVGVPLRRQMLSRMDQSRFQESRFEGSRLSGSRLDKENEYWVADRKIKGRRTIDVLAEALPGIILGIPWPKTMTWTGKSGARFIRPIRWIVALYGKKIVPFEIAGVKADRFTYGHRRLAPPGEKPKRIRVTDFESLKDGLRRNFVLLDREQRKMQIEQGIAQLLDGKNLRWRPNHALLDTLINITEFPTPILGNFDREFLALPEEVLVTVMQHHQKYFSVEDSNGNLAPHFIAVMNIDADPDGIVRHGHERVLRARFNDARFFWETDQKKKLADRVEDLKHVTFYKEETYWDKTERIKQGVESLGAGKTPAHRAAELAKCDLTTELVKEFTELQGVVGGLYARAQGEPEDVAQAIYDQYEPVPRTRDGQILALADRIDTLRTFFDLGLMPTGSKDPFALRRAALGVVQILVEGGHRHPLAELAPAKDLREFLLDRVRYYFREMKQFPYDEVNAVLAVNDILPDVSDRLEALHKVRPTENFEPLATSFKRTKNILRQAGIEDVTQAADPDVVLFEAGPERDLYEEFRAIKDSVDEERFSYEGTLLKIASLRPKVDAFFDHVLVNDPDPKIRTNCLNFLAQLLREFSTIADFSEIVIAGDESRPPSTNAGPPG